MRWISSLFSKIFAAVMAFFMTLLPAQPQPAGDVLLTLPEITTATTSFDVTIVNQTDDEIGYGLDAFTIEKQTPLGWATLKKSGDYAVAEILLLLAPGGTSTLNVNLPLMYGKTLDEGTYRIVFQYYSDSGKGSASATFTVAPAA